MFLVRPTIGLRAAHKEAPFVSDENDVILRRRKATSNTTTGGPYVDIPSLPTTFSKT